MAKTKIEWCDFSFNPWTQCTPVSPGCQNCYASARHKRFTGESYKKGVPRIRTSAANWKLPLKWNRQAEQVMTAYQWDLNKYDFDIKNPKPEKPTRPRVFCASLADVFDEEAPDEWRDDLFALISITPNLDWLLLTKRAREMARYLTNPFLPGNVDSAKCGMMGNLPDQGRSVDAYIGEEGSGYFENGYLSNLWLGVSVENQQTANERIPTLLEIPAAVRFLSCEPLLGPVDLTRLDLGIRQTQGYGPKRMEWNALTGWELQFKPDVPARCDEPLLKSNTASSGPHRRISWVIAGGESGPNARPMHPDWARDLRDQCAAANVPFLFKQWGEYFPAEDCSERSCTDGHYCDYTSNWRGAGEGIAYVKVGKKKAGRLLDGRTWDEFPEVAVVKSA